jgi:hypothetical protein
MITPLGALNLHKIGKPQKLHNFHVINFLSVNLIVNPYKNSKENV